MVRLRQAAKAAKCPERMFTIMTQGRTVMQVLRHIVNQTSQNTAHVQTLEHLRI